MVSKIRNLTSARPAQYQICGADWPRHSVRLTDVFCCTAALFAQPGLMGCPRKRTGHFWNCIQATNSGFWPQILFPSLQGKKKPCNRGFRYFSQYFTNSRL